MVKQKTLKSIHDAVRNGNIKDVEIMLAQGANVNSQNFEDDQSTLHIAVDENDIEMVEFLLSQGAEVDLKDSYGITALHYALTQSQLEIADVLIKAGGDVNSLRKDGNSALITIAEQESEFVTDKVQLVKELLARGADINIKDCDNSTALMLAASAGNCEVAKCLIDAGADLNWKGSNSMTVLQIAAEKNYLEMVKHLLSRGADINVKNDQGWSALFTAIEDEHPDVADYLIEAGIDVNCKQTLGGYNVLHMLAMKNKNASLVKKILSRNFDVNSKDHDGMSALSHALAHGVLYMADLLIEAGGDVNNQDNRGYTALHLISNAENRKYIMDCVELTKELLARGVDHNVLTSAGETALHLALHYGELEMSKVLIEAGADIGCKDKEGNTSLHYAAANNIEIVKYLLCRDADVNVKNVKNETALHIAIKWENFDVAEVLIDSGIDVNCRESSHGLTVLHILAVTNKVSLVQKLLSRGAKIDTKDSKGMTALSYALRLGELEMADIFINAGGDVNSLDNEGCTALHLITDKSQRKCTTNGVTLMKAFLTRGADVNVQSSKGHTALHSAIVLNELDMAKCLIDAGADVNCRDKHAYTALHLATLKGEVSSIRLLLSRGADVNAQCKEGHTALHIAALSKKTEVVKELLARGPDKSLRNKLGNTALEVALIVSHCRLLKEHSAVTEENTYFQDATFSKRHMNAIRKSPQFENSKSLTDVKDLKSLDPIHSIMAYNMNNLNKKVIKKLLKSAGKSRVKNEPHPDLALFYFEKLQDDELFMLFFKSGTVDLKSYYNNKALNSFI